jgi:hypothetical protein
VIKKKSNIYGIMSLLRLSVLRQSLLRQNIFLQKKILFHVDLIKMLSLISLCLKEDTKASIQFQKI